MLNDCCPDSVLAMAMNIKIKAGDRNIPITLPNIIFNNVPASLPPQYLVTMI